MRTAAILITIVLTVPAASSEPEKSGAVKINNASAATEAMVLAAIDRFEAVGLALPDLQIEVHESSDACRGFRGLFRPTAGGAIIDLCNATEHVILHELAHAWEHVHATDEARAAMLHVTGDTEWDDMSTARHSRGIEVAAEAIAFAISSQPLELNTAISNRTKLQAFEALTGMTSPRLSVPLDEIPENFPSNSGVSQDQYLQLRDAKVEASASHHAS